MLNLLKKGCACMKMIDIGYHHKHDASFVNDRHDGTDYWLLLIVKTPAVFINDRKEIHTKGNSFIIYTPQCPIYHKADNVEYINDWMLFDADKDDIQLINQLKIPINRLTDIGDISSVSMLLRSISYEYHSDRLHRMEVVNHYVRILLYKLSEHIETGRPESALSESSYIKHLIWIRENIYRNPPKEWNIDSLATELGLSRSRFQHVYNDTFGTSISQDVIRSRIQYASNLLKLSKLSIDEISHICGYSSTSYFIRQFKRITGKTPVQFRNKS